MKKYEAPTLDVVRFESEESIAASPDPGLGGSVVEGQPF